MQFKGAQDIEWEDAPEAHFTGSVRFGAHYSAQDPDDLNVLGVHFSPGARTDWHSHPGGQVLYVTGGAGYVVTEDGARAEITAGDVVHAPPGELHWHGARANSHMIHLSLTWRGATQWTPNKVSDEEYSG
jgi:quercetin dioxygenase-like cupin family protein